MNTNYSANLPKWDYSDKLQPDQVKNVSTELSKELASKSEGVSKVLLYLLEKNPTIPGFLGEIKVTNRLWEDRKIKQIPTAEIKTAFQVLTSVFPDLNSKKLEELYNKIEVVPVEKKDDTRSKYTYESKDAFNHEELEFIHAFDKLSGPFKDTPSSKEIKKLWETHQNMVDFFGHVKIKNKEFVDKGWKPIAKEAVDCAIKAWANGLKRSEKEFRNIYSQIKVVKNDAKPDKTASKTAYDFEVEGGGHLNLGVDNFDEIFNEISGKFSKTPSSVEIKEIAKAHPNITEFFANVKKTSQEYIDHGKKPLAKEAIDTAIKAFAQELGMSEKLVRDHYDSIKLVLM